MFNLEQAQMLLSMLGETLAISATLAVAVLAGYAVYQLAVMASWIYFARFVVIKVYELIKTKIDNDKNKPIEITLHGKTIARGGSENKKALIGLADSISNALSRHSCGYATDYEVRKLIEYISKYGQ